MELDDDYLNTGNWVGGIGALIAFIGGWWYCAAEYGFLFGFGLGWLPSLILAGLTFVGLRLLWGPILLLIIGVAIYAVYQ